MATIKDVLFNDGEGLDYTDLNALSRVLRSQLSDLGNLRSAFMGDTYGVGALDRTAHLWAFGDSCAPAPTGTALQIVCLPGIVQQWIAGSLTNPYTASPIALGLGEDAQCLTYYADLFELTTVHDVGDANPRFDVVSVQLSTANGDSVSRDFMDATTGAITSSAMNKRRNTTLTKTVTKGTPAATPVLPTLPAGHVALYAVYVPAGHNAVFDPAQIIDCRMPLGSFAVDVPAFDVFTRGAGANIASMTRIVGAFGGVVAGAVNAELYFTPWGAPVTTSARLIGVQALIGANNGTSTFQLKRFNANNYGGAWALIPQTPGPSSALYQPASLVLGGLPTSPATEFRGQLLGMNPFTGDTSGQDQLPVWINGRFNSFASRPEAYAAGTDNKFERVGIHWTAGNVNAEISFVRFLFAGGN